MRYLVIQKEHGADKMFLHIKDVIVCDKLYEANNLASTLRRTGYNAGVIPCTERNRKLYPPKHSYTP